MIPVIKIHEKTLAMAYEKALLALYENGMEVATDYDQPGDPHSKDCTMLIVVDNPLAEPMIHRCFPGGLADLEEYRQEVLDGIKDEFVRNPEDPDDHRWLYTYHQRIEDQLPMIVNELARNPFSRRAQFTTWDKDGDIVSEDPPCLQRGWYRCTKDEQGNLYLNGHISMRSNDAYKASFMNMFAFVMLQKRLAEELGSRLGCEVKVGQYTHFADSFHIYGKDLKDFENLFIRSVENRTFENRTYTLEFCQPFFEEAKQTIKEKVEQLRKG